VQLTPSTPVLTGGDGTATFAFTPNTGIGQNRVVCSMIAGNSVTFDIDVKATATTCQFSSQCGNGFVCKAGKCVTTGGGPDVPANSCGATDRPCPIGYVCNPSSGQCAPAGTVTCDQQCPSGYKCDEESGECVKEEEDCTTNADCPDGECRNGTCYPNGTVDIDITGNWFTRHRFDVRSALPGWVTFLATATRILDQIIHGQISGLPSWVNAIIRGIVAAYIPPWVKTLVYLLDNIFTVFSDLRADGEMQLVSIGGNKRLIRGEEYWTSFVFYILSQCGQNIGGNPSKPPPCARVDIYTSELDGANLAVDVKGFTGKVVGNGPFFFQVDRREASMKFAGIIKYVIDQVVLITTGYPSLEGPPGHPEQGALFNLIDCASLGLSVGGFNLTPICELAVAAAAQTIADELRKMTVTQDVLSFAGQAEARPGGNPTYAEELGYADFEDRMNNKKTPDGDWKGRFSIGPAAVQNVPGGWRASRQPLP